MQHSEILAKFLKHYPEYIPEITHWRPCERNSIYISFEDDTELVFIYKDEDSWILKPARKKHGKGLLGWLFE